MYLHQHPSGADILGLISLSTTLQAGPQRQLTPGAGQLTRAALQPVLLDVASIHPDRILLLDAYFSVVVFHGSTIAAWRKQGFHEQAGYASFKSLLEVRCFGRQRVVSCHQGASLR